MNIGSYQDLPHTLTRHQVIKLLAQHNLNTTENAVYTINGVVCADTNTSFDDIHGICENYQTHLVLDWLGY